MVNTENLNLNHSNGGFDIPTEFTSSIGASIWPPIETNNERLKGIYPQVIETPEELEKFLKEFESLEFKNATRISARAIISSNSLSLNLDGIQYIETLIPLTDCGIPQLHDCLLIYIGKNQPNRRTPSEILGFQYEQAYKIFFESQLLKKDVPVGFTITHLTEEEKINERVLQMYYNLYSLFGWSADEVVKMLKNPNNLLFTARNDKDEIVCSAIAEQGKMSFFRNNEEVVLSLVEITEAATLPDYRGNGLYQALSDKILEFIAQHKKPHLIYGELNLDAPAVLKVAAKQGRIPALLTAKQYQLSKSWFLEQHVVIYQDQDLPRSENYPYNNLMVAFLPQKLLIERYGN